MLTMAKCKLQLHSGSTDPLLSSLLCPCQVTRAASSPKWRRQVGTAESSKCTSLVSAFLQMIFGIWWWGTGMGTECSVEQKPSQSPGPDLVGSTVQAIEDSIWAYISLRLQRTWAKIKSSVLEIHHVRKAGTFGKKNKGPHTTCRVQRWWQAHSTLRAWLHMVSR